MKIKELILAIAICQLAGVIGSIFTVSSILTWYSTLIKPSFNPPNWLFGPVWIILYTLMGFSLYLFYTSKHKKLREWKEGLAIFGVQLILNALWSVVFFGLKNPLLGLVIIILLWLSIIATLVKFYSINKNAAYILIPYFLWVSFATILNYYIYLLN